MTLITKIENTIGDEILSLSLSLSILGFIINLIPIQPRDIIQSMEGYTYSIVVEKGLARYDITQETERHVMLSNIRWKLWFCLTVVRCAR